MRGVKRPAVVYDPPGEQILTYTRTLNNPAPNSPCTAYTTFLFFSGRLTAMGFDEAC